MEFISRVLKYLFWLLVVSWTVALLRRVVARMASGAEQSARTSEAAPGAQNGQEGLSTQRLGGDPVCGMHVAQELAVPLRDGNELVHFCSVACRDQYAFAVGRKAANG